MILRALTTASANWSVLANGLLRLQKSAKPDPKLGVKNLPESSQDCLALPDPTVLSVTTG